MSLYEFYKLFGSSQYCCRESQLVWIFDHESSRKRTFIKDNKN